MNGMKRQLLQSSQLYKGMDFLSFPTTSLQLEYLRTAARNAVNKMIQIIPENGDLDPIVFHLN